MSCNNNNNLGETRQEQEVIRSSLDGKKAFLSSNQVFFWFKERRRCSCVGASLCWPSLCVPGKRTMKLGPVGQSVPGAGHEA